VAFVSGAVWIFYVLLGALLVSAEVRGAWLLQPTMVIWEVAWFGERVQVTAALRGWPPVSRGSRASTTR
jgi:hypothetical protein